MPELSAVVALLERLAPPRLAADWDNVGLLLGDRSAEVARAVTCLTLTPPVAAEAVALGAGLVVTHHPVLFRAVKSLTADTSEGRMLWALARAGVAVYSAHTAYDSAPGGINDQLAALLGLTNVAPLRPIAGPKQVKLVVFVPDGDLSRVSEAMFAAGAGRIGEYRECGFRVAGKGTFFGSEASNPAVGVKGRREEADEWRLEVVCPERRVGEVVAAMRKAHGYEEPAFDLYPLAGAPVGGEGRVGDLPEGRPLGDLAREVSERLGTRSQVVGDAGRVVRRVAIACGAAGEMLGDAARARADVFLSGEMRFHDYLAAQSRGVALLLPGHYATERFGAVALARELASLPGLEATASAAEVDPVWWT